jgi:Zn-dependent protease with chaperone function
MAMDFFARQDQARRKTKWLIFYFVLAVACIIVLVYGVSLFALMGANSRHHHYDADVPLTLWNPQIFGGALLGTLAVVLGGCAYKMNELSSGGSALSESLGARLISSNTTDPAERRLLNVVEEMSIASGVPMPQVYLMHWEDGINAFAAGHTTSDATITVTRGCMEILSRDELQGVIGHEFSHILNGDMRTNLRLVGILFGILCLATVGRILLRVRGRNNGATMAAGLLLFIVGYVGVFFGRLIQAAVSRQREFLADASSVQFTRNPGGITGALKKIGGLGETGSQIESPHAAEVSHMFFANGVSEPLFGLLETHPPLIERIRAFEPTFDGNFPPVRYVAGEQLLEVAPRKSSRQAPPPLPNIFSTALGGAILSPGGMDEPRIIRPQGVMPNLGNPTPLHLKYAEALRDSLPDTLKAAVREPQDAIAVIYALLLSQDDALRAKQIDELAGRASRAVAEKVTALYPDVASAAAHARLPLVNLALPALRQLDASQFSQFSKTLEWLIDSDGQVELFEFVLQKIVQRRLGPQFGGARQTVVQYYTLKPLVPDCAVILSALANVGSSDPAEISKAFATGAPYIYAPENSGLTLLPVDQCGIGQLDAALNRLSVAVPNIKRNLIQAAAEVVGADGVIQENEAELLRAIADTLDCPIPPLGVSGGDGGGD